MVDLVSMVASSFPTDRRTYDSVLMLSNSTRKIRMVSEVVPKGVGLSVLTSQSRVIESLNDTPIEATIIEENLSSMGLLILTQLHDLILQAIGEGRISRGERILVVLAEPVDGVFSIDTTMLNANRFANLAQEIGIELEVLTKAMELARNIASRGREGHSVGAIFAIGPLPILRKHSTAMVLNPFKGHNSEKRSILLKDNHETFAEFAWLDGAVFFNKEGIASDAGRYIQVPSGVSTKSGEGGRHLASRAISQLGECLAICVSSSGSITVYVNGRDRYKVKMI